MSDKECSKCGTIYPATLEFFHKDKSVKFGLNAMCKLCRNPINQNYKKNNRDKIKTHYNNNSEVILKRHRKRQISIETQIGKSLTALHKRIRKIKTKTDFCVICNQSKKLELASIDHTYTENPNDYLWLCRSCHIIFDRVREVKLCH